jgi:hypothetical protein
MAPRKIIGPRKRGHIGALYARVRPLVNVKCGKPEPRRQPAELATKAYRFLKFGRLFSMKAAIPSF